MNWWPSWRTRAQAGKMRAAFSFAGANRTGGETLRNHSSTIVCLTLMLSAMAAGQTRRPNVNVQRDKPPTPEIHGTSPDKLQPGQTVTVTVNGKYFADDPKEADASGECKLNSFKFISATQI